ncbi:MAG: hypothetical protein A3F82_03145 [Deltaproteobacteria bacterium RIFCSPLOWO2_12_FULL_44_12]|nr:MAG: hypothetical protein A2712_06325 [Deltaproteobacteria bacterium RIFCSPHIGHO2_01_FULL_43_49]OGQ16003.1 MAG: hypothetical protein A3D22_06345 [Deltaproteobacteria bacterium RIFCSPHIGHO2_02_FULL_44_53]OGQ28959.1 MAG: hypothetical protein A3D98_03930 [Deltaproteobacteria bacterium RIFCSPHIGHO2_12_FULL_44_21]OGQ33170.1 MAG: hypothetical protein A2979_04095 [Deltaproteobacteria bacterium RIFCSPLOWO2_01_FULL_45_74]OGQ42266.1 MAG: hypothetical protein A3I70_06400 [Deltaproteobacteria bacterium 
MSTDTILLEAKGVDYEIQTPSGKQSLVLKEVNLSLKDGETLAILGPTGCGKSTLMRILLGLVRPTRGKVYYRGQLIKGLIPKAGVVFQNYALFPWFSVSQNIELALAGNHLEKREIKERVKKAIEKGGLIGFEEALPKELSLGFKQRVNIARALVIDPEILFMDEPFSGLDILSAESLRHDITQLLLDKQQPVDSSIFITHHILEAVFMANRIVVMGTEPGHIRSVIPNDLPFPRDPYSIPFQGFAEKIHDTIANVLIPQGSSTLKTQGLSGRVEPLPSVEIGDVMGLLNSIKDHGGALDIFEFSQEMNRTFAKVLVLIKAAEILDLIETPHHKVLLTELGKEVVQATWKRKKEILRQQLSGLSVIKSVVGLLEHSEEKKLDKDVILEQLAIILPKEDPKKIFGAILSWCQFAGMLMYDGSKHIVELRHT